MTKPLRAAGHPIVVGSAIREMKEKLDAALVIHRTQQQQVSEPFFRAFVCSTDLCSENVCLLAIRFPSAAKRRSSVMVAEGTTSKSVSVHFEVIESS